jgi:ribosomal protein S6
MKMSEQEIREKIAKEIEAIDLNEGSNKSLNAVGMKSIAINIARGK